MSLDFPAGFAPSPRLRGEGWGEGNGACPQCGAFINSLPLTPTPLAWGEGAGVPT